MKRIDWNTLDETARTQVLTRPVRAFRRLPHPFLQR